MEPIAILRIADDGYRKVKAMRELAIASFLLSIGLGIVGFIDDIGILEALAIFMAGVSLTIACLSTAVVVLAAGDREESFN